MRYISLATDYDGTIATEGVVDDSTVDALRRARRSGYHLVMVTGRRLPDLLDVFPHVDLFDRVVAENGALLYSPASREERLLTQPPPESLVQRLRERGASPLSVGRAIIATWEPYGPVALEAIRDLGLEYQVIFNKGAVMLLPSGINKAVGLVAALRELGLTSHSVVAVGDAENDHAFLRIAEASVAVANALPSVKEQADYVTAAARGAGVTELIDAMIETDLADLAPRLVRHDLLLGATNDGEDVRVPAYGTNLLVAGSSGAGKSTLLTGLMERMVKHRYQFCVVDPEGDYETVDWAVTVGSTDMKPNIDEVIEILDDPDQNVVVNLLAIPLPHRPDFFNTLYLRLQAMRTRTGRPNWIVIDEAHHVLPTEWEFAPQMLPRDLTNIALATLIPDSVSRAMLATVDLLVAVGERPDETIRNFSAATGRQPPQLPPLTLGDGQAAAWSPAAPDQAITFEVAAGTTERRRHVRKYANGDMRSESFYFRGPEGKLNLQARNLMRFLELADGLDDETWLYHLHQGDYSHWFRHRVKDEELAAEAADVERQTDLSPRDSRQKIREAIEKRYTAPVS